MEVRTMDGPSRQSNKFEKKITLLGLFLVYKQS